MARKVQLKNKSGQKIYPLTSSANVMMSDKSGSLDGKLSELEDINQTVFNVSEHYPSSGIDGSDRYTLDSAIALVPEKYRANGTVVVFRNYGNAFQYYRFNGVYYKNNWNASRFLELRFSHFNDFFKDCYLYGNVDRSKTYYLCLVCNSDPEFKNGLMIKEIDSEGNAKIVVSILNIDEGQYVFDGGTVNESGVKLKAIVDFSVFPKGNTQETLFFQVPDSAFTEGEYRRTFLTDEMKDSIASMRNDMASLEGDIDSLKDKLMDTESYSKEILGNVSRGLRKTDYISVSDAESVDVKTVCYTWNEDAIEFFKENDGEYASVEKIAGLASSKVDTLLERSFTKNRIQEIGATHMIVRCLDDQYFPDNPPTDRFGITVIRSGYNLYDKIDELEEKVGTLEEKVTQDNTVQIVIPDVINAVVGDTLQLFYEGIFNCKDVGLYEISVISNKGASYPRYWEYTPTSSDIGESDITFSIGRYKPDSVNMEVIATKKCTINTVGKLSEGNINILHVGDSTLNDGYFAKEAVRRFSGTGGSPEGLGIEGIKAVGRMKNDVYGYEASGGWTWSTYVTEGVKAIRFTVTGVTKIVIGEHYTINGAIYYVSEVNVTEGEGNIRCVYNWDSPNTNNPPESGTLTRQNSYGENKGSDENVTYTSFTEENYSPFYDNESGQVDFLKYAELYCDGDIDILIPSLGINSIISPSVTDVNSIMPDVKKFMDKYHEQFPSGKVGLCTLQLPSMKGGFGSNYGASESALQYNYKRKVFALNEAYIKLASEEGYRDFVFVINVCAEFDSEHAYPKTEKKVNLRSSEVEYIETNAVHPEFLKKGMISDSIYRAVSAHIIT